MLMNSFAALHCHGLLNSTGSLIMLESVEQMMENIALIGVPTYTDSVKMMQR